MPMLFFAAKAIHFPISDGPIEYQAYNDGTHEISGIRLNGPSSYVDTGVFAAQTDLWVHFNTNISGSFGNAAGEFLLLKGAADEPAVRIFGTNNAVANCKLQTWNGSAWVDRGAPFDQESGFLDIHVVKAVAGSVRVFKDEVEVVNYQGDTSGLPDIASARWTAGLMSSGQATIFGQVIIDTRITIGARVFGANANAAGDASGWTGSLSALSTTPPVDTTFYTASAAAVKSLFNIRNTPSGSALVPQALRAHLRGRRNTTGPNGIDFVLKSGGTEHAVDVGTVDLGFQSFTLDFATNPITAAPWTLAGIDALQIGMTAKTV